MAGPHASAVIRRPEWLPAAVKDRRTHDDEECRPPPPPKRRPGRPCRVRQDDAGRAAALPGRGDPPARSRRRRLRPPRFRARGAEAAGVAEPGGRHLRIRRNPISLLDTPGYPDFVAEVVEGYAAADGAILVMDASGGVEAGLEQAVAQARATNTAACFFINKSDRENANPTEALDALRSDVRDQDRAAQPGHRRGESSRATSTSSTARRSGSTVRRRSRSRSRTSFPARSRPAATSCWRPPPRRTTTS